MRGERRGGEIGVEMETGPEKSALCGRATNECENKIKKQLGEKKGGLNLQVKFEGEILINPYRRCLLGVYDLDFG